MIQDKYIGDPRFVVVGSYTVTLEGIIGDVIEIIYDNITTTLHPRPEFKWTRIRCNSSKRINKPKFDWADEI